MITSLIILMIESVHGYFGTSAILDTKIPYRLISAIFGFLAIRHFQMYMFPKLHYISSVKFI